MRPWFVLLTSRSCSCDTHGARIPPSTSLCGLSSYDVAEALSQVFIGWCEEHGIEILYNHPAEPDQDVGVGASTRAGEVQIPVLHCLLDTEGYGITHEVELWQLRCQYSTESGLSAGGSPNVDQEPDFDISVRT